MYSAAVIDCYSLQELLFSQIKFCSTQTHKGLLLQKLQLQYRQKTCLLPGKDISAGSMVIIVLTSLPLLLFFSFLYFLSPSPNLCLASHISSVYLQPPGQVGADPHLMNTQREPAKNTFLGYNKVFFRIKQHFFVCKKTRPGGSRSSFHEHTCEKKHFFGVKKGFA